METTVYLVRHAESCPCPELSNQEWPLSPRGVEQAEAMTPVLQKLRACHVYTSPALRCRATLQPFLEGAQLPVTVREDLGERQVGSHWLPNYRAVWCQSWDDFDFAPAGGESSHTCRHRMMNALSVVARHHPGQPVIVCTHGHAMSLVLSAIDPSFSMQDALRLRTPEILKLSHDGSAFAWNRDHNAGAEFQSIVLRPASNLK